MPGVGKRPRLLPHLRESARKGRRRPACGGNDWGRGRCRADPRGVLLTISHWGIVFFHKRACLLGGLFMIQRPPNQRTRKLQMLDIVARPFLGAGLFSVFFFLIELPGFQGEESAAVIISLALGGFYHHPVSPWSPIKTQPPRHTIV